MLLTSVIIVLREVLEAALLISILSALSVTHGISRRWVAWSLFSGFLAALALASAIDPISEAFDGVGQEVVSALMQFGVFLCLTLLVFLMVAHASASRLRQHALVSVMALSITLAVAREGFEILVYVFGYAGNAQQLMIALVGSAIGAAIGISVGVIIYYLLGVLTPARTNGISLLLLVLVSAGLCSQAALLLIQADWLPSQLPLWDTSIVIAESSMTGQLLYALVGYQANPSPLQVGFYVGGLLLMSVVIALAYHRRMHDSRHDDGTGNR